jgi:hypothetical protein
MLVEGVGKKRVKALICRKWSEREIHNVEYVPGGANLFSENVLLDKGFEVTKTQRGDIVYHFEGRPDSGKIAERREAAYGLENMLKEDLKKCEICIKAKSKKKRHKTVEKSVKYKPGERVHSDLLHSTLTSRKGNKYFLVVKHEGSSFRQVYFQKEKSESVKNAKYAIIFLNNQTENTVKLFRLDNGTEFVNEELKEFFSAKGIQFGLNAQHNSQSNGMIERDVRTGQDAARAMLIQSKLSKQHWEDAMRTTCYLLNGTLISKNTGKTPYELIFKKKPSLHHVRVFGCKAFAHVTSNRNNLFVACL